MSSSQRMCVTWQRGARRQRRAKRSNWVLEPSQARVAGSSSEYFLKKENVLRKRVNEVLNI